MKYRIIDEQLSRIATLVESWKSGNAVPSIERDIALSILRSLYDNIGNINAEQHCDSGNTRPEEAVVVEAEYQEKTKAERDVEAETDSDASFDDALDIDALLGLSAPIGDVADKEATAEAERVEEAVKEAEEVTEEVTEEVIEEVIEEGAASGSSESTQRSKIGGLFDIDDIPVRSRSSRKMISLYNTPAQQPKAEPQHDNTPKPEHTPVTEIEEEAKIEVTTNVEEVPVVEEPRRVTEPVVEESASKSIAEVVATASEEKRLGEVLGGGVTTLADKMAAEEQPTTPFNRISDLHKAIGLNDKFLMIRDLFEGDAERYNDTIDTLNEFDDLDECMIYIVENFAWNPDSEGAKLLVSLIERKLS